MSNDTVKSTLRHGVILCVFALLATGLITLTYENTAPRIKAQEQRQLQLVLNAIIDSNSYDNDMQHDCTLVRAPQLLGSYEKKRVFRARQQGEDVALAIETVAPDGYSGKIDLIVGIRGEGQVTGVRVLSHKETPGLGDKVDIRVSDWILTFSGKILNDSNRSRWQVKKDGGEFDAFTGATITPRAVVAAVARTIEYYQSNRHALFQADANCTVTSAADKGNKHE